MKKYRVSFMRKFTAKNEKQYCALELLSVEASKDKNTGVYLGHRSYSILTKAENVPDGLSPDDYVTCSVSFDKKTGRPFAYNFSKFLYDVPLDTSSEEFRDDPDLPF